VRSLKMENEMISLPLPPVTGLLHKCMEHGAHTLSLGECLSIISQGKMVSKKKPSDSKKRLSAFSSDLSEEDQTRAVFRTLERISGGPLPEIGILSRPEEARVFAAFELARRYHFYVDQSRASSGKTELSVVTKLALERISEKWRCSAVEWLGFIPVYRSKVGNLCIIEKGVRTHVNVDPGELFARILALRPDSFFLFHNHPSGNLEPSKDDHNLTMRVDQISRQLGVKLAGHFIVSGSKEREVPYPTFQ